MSYKIYKFERPTIDTERRVSFTRGALVRTNDESWIAKFGKSVSVASASDEDSVFTVEALDADEKEVKPKIAKKSKRPSTPKKRNFTLGVNKAVLSNDVDNKSSEDSE